MSIRFLMIDTETTSVFDDAKIIQLSAVICDVKNDISLSTQDYLGMANSRTFDTYIDYKDQKRYNRTDLPSTIEWWKAQDKALRDNLFHNPNAKTLKYAIDDFLHWLTTHQLYSKNMIVVERGGGFDTGKISHAIEISLGMTGKTPWHYGNCRDIRTWLGAIRSQNPDIMVNNYFNPQLDLEIGATVDMQKHNSLHDAITDTMRLKAILNTGVVTI